MLKANLERADHVCSDQADVLHETAGDLEATRSALSAADVSNARLTSENLQLEALLARERADSATLQVRVAAVLSCAD